MKIHQNKKEKDINLSALNKLKLLSMFFNEVLIVGGIKIQDLVEQLVSNRMVKKYVIRPHNIERFLVVGYHQEYIVLNKFCGCKDFQRNLTKLDDYKCKHILAVQLAKERGEYDTFVINQDEYRN
ncbi:MAG: SWIM zinc finger family protein, partial [Candidatus Hodarchaeota archaeon]